MDEIDIMDTLKAGRANPLPREQAIRLLTKIIARQIEAGNLEGDAEQMATEIVDGRVTDGQQLDDFRTN